MNIWGDNYTTSYTEPDFSKAVDINRYLRVTFGICGCADFVSMLEQLIKLLEFMDLDDRAPGAYGSVFESIGVYYWLATIVDNAGLCEHGVAIRVPWLTPKGKALLVGLKLFTLEQIDEASGDAYDGTYVGE